MGLGVVSWRGERAGQVCYLRRGATGPADVRTGRLCGRPHASRGAALLELGGPLRGRGEGRGADCPWHSDPFRVRARYGVGWGCAVRLRVRWGCAVGLISAGCPFWCSGSETANSQNADIESIPDLLFCYIPP